MSAASLHVVAPATADDFAPLNADPTAVAATDTRVGSPLAPLLDALLIDGEHSADQDAHPEQGAGLGALAYEESNARQQEAGALDDADSQSSTRARLLVRVCCTQGTEGLAPPTAGPHVNALIAVGTRANFHPFSSI